MRALQQQQPRVPRRDCFCDADVGAVRRRRQSTTSTAAAAATPSIIHHQQQLWCSSRPSSSSSSSTGGGAPAAAAAAAHAADPHAAIQQLLSARGLDVDVGLVAQEAAATYEYLTSQQDGLLPTGLTAEQLVERALLLSDLLATGSTFRTLQMLKRHPALLQMPPDVVANQVLQLKLLLPASNVAQLLFQKPSLLLIRDLPAVVGTALAKLHALMPGIPVEGKLHEGGTVFWSFASLLPQDTGFAAAAASTTSSRGGAGASGNAAAAAAAAAVTEDGAAS